MAFVIFMDNMAIGLFTPQRSLRQKAERFPSVRYDVYKCVCVYMILSAKQQVYKVDLY